MALTQFSSRLTQILSGATSVVKKKKKERKTKLVIPNGYGFYGVSEGDTISLPFTEFQLRVGAIRKGYTEQFPLTASDREGREDQFAYLEMQIDPFNYDVWRTGCMINVFRIKHRIPKRPNKVKLTGFRGVSERRKLYLTKRRSRWFKSTRFYNGEHPPRHLKGK